MPYEADIVIIGAGIAGSALATELARNGISCLVLEKTTEHKDRVRGEWMAPWGVVEAKRLGVYDSFREAGGHHVMRHIETGDIWSQEEAWAHALELEGLLPGIPGPLCLGHPRMCDLLNESATTAGATLVRGVSEVRVEAGTPPAVSFRHQGERHGVRPRLIVGADGRNSIVRKQAGIPMESDEPHHFMAGLLVDGVEGWPEDTQTVGTEGDGHFLVFPQGHANARLYLCYDPKVTEAMSGEDGARRFLEAFRTESLPHGASIADATPAGPCASFPNADTWCDEPFAPGVLLIADAAGHNDPLIGQGLSIALRDVRIVRDLLLEHAQWSTAAFAPYAEERKERMRRLRFVARLFSVIAVEFGPEAEERRKRAFGTMAEDMEAAMPRMAAFVGPELLPESAFSREAWERLVPA